MKSKLLSLGVGLLIGAGLGILILFRLGGRDLLTGAAGQFDLSRPAVRIGSPAPDFELESLAGEKVRLSDLRGSVVIVNFWATWCEPCKEEMPLFQARYGLYAPELKILAIDFAEPVKDVQAFTEKYGLTFNILLDSRAMVQEMYQVRGYPTTYIIDKDGIVRVEHLGPISDKQLDQYLAKTGVGDRARFDTGTGWIK